MHSFSYLPFGPQVPSNSRRMHAINLQNHLPVIYVLHAVAVIILGVVWNVVLLLTKCLGNIERWLFLDGIVCDKDVSYDNMLRKFK